MNIHSITPEARKSFNKASRTPPKAKKASPFAVRLTDEERAYLKRKAGTQPLGTYIRACILGEQAEQRRSYRQPRVNDQQLAAVLAELGNTHLSSNVNQLARAVNTGTLDVSEDVEQQLHEAYEAILAMREALFVALGLKCGGDNDPRG